MTDDATGRLDAVPGPAAEALSGVLFDARPGGQGELMLRVCDGGRLIDLTLALSAGDRANLIRAAAAMQARGSQAVSLVDTVRRPAGGPN